MRKRRSKQPSRNARSRIPMNRSALWRSGGIDLLLPELMKYLVSIERNCARENHSARNPQAVRLPFIHC
jgi:hypothetical protein